MSLTLACLEDFILALLQDLWLATLITDCDSFRQFWIYIYRGPSFFTEFQIDFFYHSPFNIIAKHVLATIAPGHDNTGWTTYTPPPGLHRTRPLGNWVHSLHLCPRRLLCSTCPAMLSWRTLCFSDHPPEGQGPDPDGYWTDADGGHILQTPVQRP